MSFGLIFKSAIHEQQTLPAVSKFNYLIEECAERVSTVSNSRDTTYKVALAVKLLQERFGRKEAIMESLYSKL